MAKSARDYTPRTIKRLHVLSMNECANPECSNQFIAKDKSTIISKICHIKAASPDGPRYDKNMTDDERRSYANLILLCDECHSIIDNEDNEAKYTVDILENWKIQHERKGFAKKLTTQTSLLKLAIYALSDATIDENISGDVSLNAFDISEKISYNSIKENRFLIEEYKVYHAKINSLYDELERQGSFKKETLLKNINRIYLRVKGNYATSSNGVIQDIRKNSDAIIDDVTEQLIESAKDDDRVTKEDLELATSLIIVDAFMRCKILEEPNKSDS